MFTIKVGFVSLKTIEYYYIIIRNPNIVIVLVDPGSTSY